VEVLTLDSWECLLWETCDLVNDFDLSCDGGPNRVTPEVV
jgi:hypothetical protein